MKPIIYIIIIAVCSCTSNLFAQEDPTWDNTAKNKWNPALEEVSIPSTTDEKIQKAVLYKAKSSSDKPLIVSLHTWSGDYMQKDPLVKEILERDWNYIHPDFRGPNNQPDAMCSPLVLSDLEDAIAFALKHTNADPEEVHIIGVSGGGLATLFAYMNIGYPVKSFSAWVPISDIDAWYWESVGRQQKYAHDILKSVSATNTFNRENALLRSPLHQSFPKEKRERSTLFIYAGIHDGYTGSVPITHSLHMYNRLVGELKYNTAQMETILSHAKADPDLISEKEMIDLITKRMNPHYNKYGTLLGRNIHLVRYYKNIRITIFEGSHEQIPQALTLLPME